MFAFTSFSDVVAVAKTFGTAAIEFAIQNNTLHMEAGRLVADCKKWAANESIEIVSFNDGNVEYSIDAVFTSEKLGGEYYTGLENITIVRTGFGASRKSIEEAFNNGDITRDTIRYIVNEIKARSEARIILGL